MQAIIVNGSAEEIAALAKEMQERQKKPFVPETADGPCFWNEVKVVTGA